MFSQDPPPRSRGLLLPVTAAVVWGAEVASPNLLCPPRPLRLLKCDQPFVGSNPKELENVSGNFSWIVLIFFTCLLASPVTSLWIGGE